MKIELTWWNLKRGSYLHTFLCVFLVYTLHTSHQYNWFELKSTNATIGCEINNADKTYVEKKRAQKVRNNTIQPNRMFVLIMQKECTFEDYYGGYMQ